MNNNFHDTEFESRIQAGGLNIAPSLYTFVGEEALLGTGIDPDVFWSGVASIIEDLTPRNHALLARRAELQDQLDAFHLANPGRPDPATYKRLLGEIGYLVDDPDDFAITTSNVDSEITSQTGPQLVVPMLNARFATNAVNARWGSLYDALYGSDAISEEGVLARGDRYNAARGAEAQAWGRRLLDESVPLESGSHADATGYRSDADGVLVTLSDGTTVRLQNPAQFLGYTGRPDSPTSILLVHNGLRLEVQFDAAHPIGASDAAGVKDIILESALTSIMDLEDSVAAVDAEDKTLGYRNWLLLNQGILTEQFTKGGEAVTRRMHGDREFTTVGGELITVPGRALMFIRHVGLHMMTDAVLDADGNEVPEGIIDAAVSAACALHDLQGNTALRNSRTGSMYIVKPKLHGPDEVQFTVDLFSRVEQLLGLAPLTLKLGIMDEERRTTVNLASCIKVASNRVVFINTGFLDRTGDEIHTSIHAGPIVRKADLKAQSYITTYELRNVQVGLSAGFASRAQIGKGMWAVPNQMAAMLAAKIAHPAAGATTAWVPSPTAATLHALHYHAVDVTAVQEGLLSQPAVSVDPILEIPLAASTNWTAAEKHAETDSNLQGILGYVVRWVNQGIGCSTVADIDDVGLMEDRATLRISSQLLANWLTHGIITEADVLESMLRVAPIVDAQNAFDPLHEALVTEQGPSLAFEAARDLVILGAASPQGYTEPILHAARRAKKAAARVTRGA